MTGGHLRVPFRSFCEYHPRAPGALRSRSGGAMSIIAPMLVSIGVPLVFLIVVRRLDLYASGSIATVLYCVVAGLAAFPAAYVLNSLAGGLLVAAGLSAAVAGFALRTSVAPVIEEILKSAGVVYFERRPEFTYFVDGAIFGFASGTAFAIVENLSYLQAAPPGQALGPSINRAFSTSLMHGSATALVGVSIGRFRFERGGARAVALFGGWAFAMLMHSAFNRLVNSGELTPGILAGAFGIGLGGVVLTALWIRMGLADERAWLRESLGLDVGVSKGESEIVQQLSDVKALLAPVEQVFGVEKRDAVERFLRIQARLGLKQQSRGLTSDPRLKLKLGEEVEALGAEVDELRRFIGIYCMSYVRSIMPPEAEDLWVRLDDKVTEALADRELRGSTFDLWKSLEGKT